MRSPLVLERKEEKVTCSSYCHNCAFSIPNKSFFFETDFKNESLALRAIALPPLTFFEGQASAVEQTFFLKLCSSELVRNSMFNETHIHRKAANTNKRQRTVKHVKLEPMITGQCNRFRCTSKVHEKFLNHLDWFAFFWNRKTFELQLGNGAADDD